MIGKIVSHYRIIEHIGSGGMGDVYKSEDIKLKRTVALKFLPFHLSRDISAKNRFIHEAKAASILDHPNICNVHEVGEDKKGRMYICMSYYEGTSLQLKIEDCKLKIEESIDIAIQIARGLAKAHDKKIIHRDIKPANIIITNDGTVKILDFGLAKLSGQTQITKESTKLGTVSYMSPEQIKGEPADHRSDIWALGIILYQMLTGTKPFRGDFDEVMFYAVLHTEPEPVSGLNAEIPPGLEKIVQKALEKNPKNRYQKISTLLNDLIDEQRNLKEDAKSLLRNLYRLKKVIRTKKGIFIAAVLFLVVICTYFWMGNLKQPSLMPVEKISVGILHFENNTQDESLEYLGRNISDLLIADLVQSRFLRVLSSNKLYGILSELNHRNTIFYPTKILKEVASRGNCDYLITGNYIKAGTDFHISAILQNMTTGDQSEIIEKGAEEQIFNMVDDLTKQIKRQFNLSDEKIAQDIDRPVAEITTESSDAYSFYLLGKEYLHKDEKNLAEQNLQVAIQIDPEFAMAYMELYKLYSKNNLFVKAKIYMEKALALKDRLTDRERLMIDGDYFASLGKLNKSVNIYNECIQLYPSDIDVLLRLKGAYNGLEDYDELLRLNRKLCEIRPVNLGPDCAEIYLHLGDYDKAEKMLEWYQDNYPPHKRVHTFYVWLYSGKRKYDLSLRELDLADSLYSDTHETILDRGRIHLWTGNYAEAENAFKKALMQPDDTARSWSYTQLFGLYLHQGRINDAIEILKEGGEWAKKTKNDYWIGSIERKWSVALYINGDYQQSLREAEWGMDIYMKIANYLAMGMIDEAQNEADKYYESILDNLKKPNLRECYLLQGMIDLEKNDYTLAIEQFKKALEFAQPNPEFWFYNPQPHAKIYYYLAIAYYRAGEIEKSIDEYLNLVNLINLRQFDGYTINKGNYELAKIYEELDKKEEAIKYYKEFLHIWREADEDLPELINAKKRLAILKNSRELSE